MDKEKAERVIKLAEELTRYANYTGQLAFRMAAGMGDQRKLFPLYCDHLATKLDELQNELKDF